MMRIEITKLPNKMALGGVLQSHGSDWTNGTIHIDAGGSHESNPYEGIQVGKDESGIPNLVEEGERIFDDYVYSKRIYADEGTLEKFHLSKKRKITFADLAELLEKESKERPNDPVSRAGLKAQMHQLADEQERQKQEMEAARAREAFEALSPEEQTAIMQQAAQQEAMAQQAVENQAIAEQQPEYQPSPEEIAAMQKQADEEQQQLAEMQANVSALGGELVRAKDVNSNANVFAKGGRKARRVAKNYNKQWFINQARSLGMIGKDADDIEGFTFVEDDPTANLANFNNIYRQYQRNKALETYSKGQRQSKKNELFGNNGVYSFSDDKSKIYKARINDSDRNGWISKDYTGAVDKDGNLLGFIDQAAYDKLSDNDKEAYKRINEKAGNKMYDYNGRVITDLYNGTEDDILKDYDFENGFTWDDKNAQTLQYPVELEHSTASNLRYFPTLGGAIGLFENLFSNPDYSRAEGVVNAGNIAPAQITPHYIGDYLRFRPMDIWAEQNQLNAQSRATDRTLRNLTGPSRAASIIINGYNSQLASGQLFRNSLEYNDADRFKKGEYNRGTNKFNAEMDVNTQKANQSAINAAQDRGFKATVAGMNMMDDIDRYRSTTRNANLTNLLTSIGNIGEEAYDEDRLKWLEGTGVLRSNVYDNTKYGSVNKYGGMLTKKSRKGGRK